MMTSDAKLANLKLMDYPTDMEDEKLMAYLDIAGSAIINRAHPFDDSVLVVPRRYEYLQIEIALYLCNKAGAEGETSHSENGIDRTYESGRIPESYLKEIVPLVGIPYATTE